MLRTNGMIESWNHGIVEWARLARWKAKRL